MLSPMDLCLMILASNLCSELSWDSMLLMGTFDFAALDEFVDSSCMWIHFDSATKSGKVVKFDAGNADGAGGRGKTHRPRKPLKRITKSQ